jgi:hypothetical protein
MVRLGMNSRPPRQGAVRRCPVAGDGAALLEMSALASCPIHWALKVLAALVHSNVTVLVLLEESISRPCSSQFAVKVVVLAVVMAEATAAPRSSVALVQQ